MSTITKEQVHAISDLKAGYTLGHADVAILNQLARIALASLGTDPVVSHIGSKNALDAIVDFIKSNRNPTLKDNNEVSSRLFQDNCHGLSNHVIEYIKQIGDELEELRSTQDSTPPAPVSVPDEVYAELYQLREEVKGPGGFNTWRDAATTEKVLRLSMERDALRYRFLRDKDAFGDENEHGLASWDDLAEMGYNEFDAAVDARINDSDIPKYSITQSHMVENDVAASEKNVPNERYKQISDIDYLGAMAAFHSDEWHKMGPITGYMHGWNACRAAMLQGAEPVTKANKLPDGWVACSERMPEEGDDMIVFTDDIVMPGVSYSKKKGFYLQALGYDDDEPVDNVTHWMPLPSPPAK
ncbi:hypothetical protein WP8W19C02_10270 [Enterobacter cloacae]|nr:hypothetical protein WP8W19C02_10270 [Enterobacter cloacae]